MGITDKNKAKFVNLPIVNNNESKNKVYGRIKNEYDKLNEYMKFE